jgi:hypothetical protein
MIEQRIEDLHRTTDGSDIEPLTTAGVEARPSEGNSAGLASERPERTPLFPESDLGNARLRWQEVQGSFVDDPRIAVRNADELVASLMTRLAQVFADERSKLEQEWDRGDNVSTENLRLALQRYRSFFDRLLSV